MTGSVGLLEAPSVGNLDQSPIRPSRRERPEVPKEDRDDWCPCQSDFLKDRTTHCRLWAMPVSFHDCDHGGNQTRYPFKQERFRVTAMSDLPERLSLLNQIRLSMMHNGSVTRGSPKEGLLCITRDTKELGSRDTPRRPCDKPPLWGAIRALKLGPERVEQTSESSFPRSPSSTTASWTSWRIQTGLPAYPSFLGGRTMLPFSNVSIS
ncbi:hypothetical protein V8F20_008099 [Naviculisporaceae sp. PSN 640]